MKGFEEGGLCFREGRPVRGSLVGLTDTDLAESGNVQKSLDFWGWRSPCGRLGDFFPSSQLPESRGIWNEACADSRSVALIDGLFL